MAPVTATSGGGCCGISHPIAAAFPLHSSFPFSPPPDEATLELMKTPRCSLPDMAGPAARRKRHTQAVTKWNKRNLSWR